MKTAKIAILAIAAGLYPWGEAPAGDPQRGEQQYAVCAACHGADGAGNPVLRAPRIAGLDSDYVATQLQLFRDGTRGHPESAFADQMRGIALTLADDRALDDVAAYVETLPAPPPPPAISGDPDRGRLAYGMCAPCHGQSGEGREVMHAPRLAGQTDLYLYAQIRAFRDGLRGYDPEDLLGTQMRTMALMLKDEQMIEDVVTYLSALDAPDPAPTISGEAERGAETYQQLCAVCHAETGTGDRVLNAPRLAGQHDWYLIHQLKLFRAGLRGAHPDDVFGEQMSRIAYTLEDEQVIKDVITYINSLGKSE